MGCVCVKEAAVQDVAAIGRERTHGSKRRACASGRLNPVDSIDTGYGDRDKPIIPKRISADGGKHKQWIPSEGDVKLRNLPKHTEGEQVAAGWPAWLSAVAGEAIKGWIPRRADSFEKLDKIGQGTYSSVYRARDLETRKIVALKKVRFDNLEPESVRFMAREIQVLRRLNHPNIVKLEGLVTSRMSCSLYLVFEYMEHDLTGLAACSGAAFTEPQVKCYVQQLLRGLDHCHTHGVLHRDIKGSNLLINNNGILKIADFGLSTLFCAGQSQPLTSRVVTLWYRPPELLLGVTEYGVGVDLWSAGCILAELLAGKPILPGRTEVEQLHKIFKLCGSPPEEYWRKSKLPHATIFKPKQPYKSCLVETFKDFPSSGLSLLEVLLAIEPPDRGTAALALKSEFFCTKPLACDPSNLPKYPPSKEMDAKLRDEIARRQRAAAGRIHGADAGKRLEHVQKVGAVPEANAELAASIQKHHMMSQPTKSMSEKFKPKQEDQAMGFPIDPSCQPGDDVGMYALMRRGSTRGIPNATLVKKQKDDDLSLSPASSIRSTGLLDSDSKSGYSHRVDLSNLSDLLASRNNAGNAISQTQMPFKGAEGETSARHDRPAWGNKGKAPHMHFSGPLLHPSFKVEEIMGEHERRIQQAVRQSRQSRSRHQAVYQPRTLDSSATAMEMLKFDRKSGTLTSSGRRRPPRVQQPDEDEIVELHEAGHGLTSVVENYEKESES